MNWRYRSVLLFFLFFFLCITARLFYWQTVRAQELTSLGESQSGYRIKLIPKRGEIRTSDGFAIAANKITYLTFANPKEIKNKEQEAQILSPLLDVDAATISALLSYDDRYWVALKSKVEHEQKEKIEKLNLPGVGFEEQTVRFYPEASMAAKLLGFVGKSDTGEDVGSYGLEGYYDRQLRGKTGLAVQVHDAFGRPILAKMNDTSGAIDGRNLNLHIDRTFQFIMEDELEKGIKAYGALDGMAIAMDPKTGGILAMASFPKFDPRSYADYSEDLYKDPLVSDLYEPGSTFKPIVMAAAIDAGLVKPDTKCTICDKPVSIGGYEIRTWNNEYTPNESMTDVIIHSDNTGMVFVSQKLGLDKMLSYFKKYGIGEMTGVDLQGEVQAYLRDSWYPIDVATASFGQGLTVTPVELISAFASIANKGVRMEPHVVASVETPEGETIPIPPKEVAKPISEATAKIMTEILVDAVNKGESKWTRLPGYRIAGKTGTAQIPIAGHYDPKHTIPSFIGFAPADNPKFVMLVVLNSPTSSIYGAETAAPIFFKIAQRMLLQYGIPPDPNIP